MPTYVYRFVKTGETIEVQQSYSDDTLTKHKHPETGRMMAVKKVFQPVGVTFKGSGFFKTDSRGSSSNGSSETSKTSSESTKSADTTSSGDSTSSGSGSTSKPAATTSTSSAAD